MQLHCSLLCFNDGSNGIDDCCAASRADENVVVANRGKQLGNLGGISEPAQPQQSHVHFVTDAVFTLQMVTSR
jgi:hypothetical protein